MIQMCTATFLFKFKLDFYLEMVAFEVNPTRRSSHEAFNLVHTRLKEKKFDELGVI